jgi:type I restriction enzyme, S subunit
MTVEWERVRLGNLVRIAHGWPFRSELYSEELTGRPIVVSIGNFNYTGGFRFDSTTSKEYRGDYPSEFNLKAGEILLVMTCQTAGGEILGIPARVPDDGKQYLHNQRLGKVILRDHRADPTFLYYLFLSPEFNRELTLSASGTKILHTAPSRIEAFEFRLPPLQEQVHIGHILCTLDDKIELNRKMNETLEAMARALFKSWFVDFDPVHAKAEGRDPGLPAHLASLFPDSFEGSELGEIPAGWRVGSVGELATLHKTTVSPSSKPSDTFAHYSIPAYDEGRIPRIEEGLDIKSNKFTIPRGAVLVSKLNPSIPRVWLVDVGGHDRPICSTEFLVVLPRSAHYREFLYLLFKSDHSRRELTGMATGTSNSHQRVRPEGLMEMRIAIPPRQLLSRFSESCAPMMERANHSIWESASIASLRDSLLPKLISGQLRLDQPPHPDWSAAGTCNAR